MKATATSLGLVVSLMIATTASAETIRWLPAAASNDGAQGTRWTTTLWVHSMASDAPVTVHAAFFATREGDPDATEVAIEAPPVQPVEIQDAVMNLFGESRSGAIRLRSEHPFEARSRTFNQGGEGGTFGQGIRAVDPDEALAFGALVGVANIPGDGGVRSNLGVLNPGDEAAEVWVFVLKNDDNGDLEYLNTFDMTVGPHGWVQGNLFALADDEDVVLDNAWAVVAADFDPVGPRTPVLFYLSRIDNRSGDATYIEPFLNLAYWVEPEPVEVRYSVATTEPFSLYAVTYPDASGDTVTVIDPPRDWSVEVQATLGQTLCLEAIGHVTGAGGGGVEACVQEAGGDPASATCNRCEGDASQLCRVETCRFFF